MATEIDKDSDSIIITTDGVRNVRTIRRQDTVVSIPPSGYKKIYNFYWNPDTEGIVMDVSEEVEP